MPLKPDPNYEEEHGEPEIGACVKPVFDKKSNSIVLQVIKRVARENQIVYG
jgi:hypothetical protein